MTDTVKIAMRRRRETVRYIARMLAGSQHEVWATLTPTSKTFYLEFADKIVSKVQRRMKDWSW